ncbi:probable glutamate receptor [Eriocheir sinensis]|uniref:probable glutamate receptor n=1 Tax=Eriocheir sinensis TaxID=95602 RepID=UPI0021C9E34B|nr:probable glutamate receptor [Eriocheir sinensis]
MEGAMVNFLNMLAVSMNFTCRVVRPADKSFGSLQEDGTWTGMLGLVTTGEADVALGPFAVTESRRQAVAYSEPVSHTDLTIVSAEGSLEINPWAFLLPLTPAVWCLLGAVLLLVWAMTFLLDYAEHAWVRRPHSVFLQLYGVVMQQGVTMKLEGVALRAVVGGWVVVASLLVWSYSGLLVSVMTVRLVPRPIQTARDLLDHSRARVIMRANTAYTDTLAGAQTGVLRDLWGLRARGRLHWEPAGTARWFTLMRRGDHASIVTSLSIGSLRARDFSSTGSCRLYSAKESLVLFSYSMITQKNVTAILPAVNARVQAVVESGLYDYWLLQGIPNASACDNAPSKVTVHQPFDLASLWAVFLVSGAGLAAALLVFALEMCECLPRHPRQHRLTLHHPQGQQQQQRQQQLFQRRHQGQEQEQQELHNLQYSHH